MNNFKEKVKDILPEKLSNRVRKISRNYHLNKINKNYYNILDELIKSSNMKRIILIGTAVYGNIGDHAISIAEILFLKEKFPEAKLIEIPISFYETNYKKINKYINTNDLIIINGGGFLGTLWKDGQDIANKIILSNPENNIIIFPQTVYYKKDSSKIIKSHEKIINDHSNVSIIVRDKKSHKFLLDSNFKFKNICLTPDIVSYIEFNRFNKSKNNSNKNKLVTFILRSDQEKIEINRDLKKIRNFFMNLGHCEVNFVYTDSVVPGNFDFNNRDDLVENFLEEIGKSDFVVSDRLHGMLLAAICGIPVIALDNISKKVYGAYEWFEDFPYVLYFEDKNLFSKAEMLLNNDDKFEYKPSYFSEYHKKIENLIIEELDK